MRPAVAGLLLLLCPSTAHAGAAPPAWGAPLSLCARTCCRPCASAGGHPQGDPYKCTSVPEPLPRASTRAGM